ncbi:hypothetical protein ABK040_010417 [Willaertia magna]
MLKRILSTGVTQTKYSKKLSNNFNSLFNEHKNLIVLTNPASSQLQKRNKYSDKVIDHYKRPRNVGNLDKNDPNVGTAIVGAPSCGDVLKFQIKVDENGKVIDAAFKTFGCGSAIASSSYATELVKGKYIEDCMRITNKDISSHLALPPVKKHCSLLAEEAIKAATEDYLNKKKEHASSSH